MNFNIAIKKIPHIAPSTFRSHISSEVQEGKRLIALWASEDPIQESKDLKLFAVLGNDCDGKIEILSTTPPQDYLSITEECPQAHLFEREIWENFNLTPAQHPWLKPVRFLGNKSSIGKIDYYKTHGDEIHEVGVGPVHAGIIEPGHFRFQCHGEIVQHLEISLGYQHRGIEKKLVGGPYKNSLHYIETVAGDTTIGHTLAYCKNIEALSQVSLSRYDQLLRAIMLELERLANHVGDLGALAGDVGFLPTANYCGRIRGEYLNLSQFICGSRFGRSMLEPGKNNFDLPKEKKNEFLTRLRTTARDTKGAIELLWQSSSVMDRFEGTGIITEKRAREIGLVGPAARACKVLLDVRKNYPHYGIYEPLGMVHAQTGDVLARAQVRYYECLSSLKYIEWAIGQLEQEDKTSSQNINALLPEQLSLSLVEGWRGEICHIAQTNQAGRIHNYKIIDPSFHNWFGLALALRGQEISDFPLCNKSFNLSYCGFDL